MQLFNSKDILETINMVREECLDVRTVTMGISLYDCVSEDEKRICDKIYEKLCGSAGNLVPICDELEKKYGIPIVNKRISVTPISLIGGDISTDGYVNIAKTLDRAGETLGVNFVGGFTALAEKETGKQARRLLNSIPQALSSTKRVCSSINAASTKAGLNMNVVADCGRIIKDLSEKTADEDSIGCAKFVVFANAPNDNPFMAGAFHGTGEADRVINVGVSGPGVVAAAVKRAGDCSLIELSEIIKRTAFKITRAGQLIANEAADKLDSSFGVVDLSLAPTPAIGDSVALILEEMGLEKCGGPGTTAALAMLNDAVKKGGVMASSSVGGLSGAFIPVSEDAGMISAAREGALTIEKLEAMTAVCSVGLDMIAIPGDTSEYVISGIIADELSIGVANTKTTAVRIIPAYGKKEGDEVVFGGLLGSAPVMRVNNYSPEIFVKRGGRIPAPIHSLKN